MDILFPSIRDIQAAHTPSDICSVCCHGRDANTTVLATHTTCTDGMHRTGAGIASRMQAKGASMTSRYGNHARQCRFSDRPSILIGRLHGNSNGGVVCSDCTGSIPINVRGIAPHDLDQLWYFSRYDVITERRDVATHGDIAAVVVSLWVDMQHAELLSVPPPRVQPASDQWGKNTPSTAQPGKVPGAEELCVMITQKCVPVRKGPGATVTASLVAQQIQGLGRTDPGAVGVRGQLHHRPVTIELNSAEALRWHGVLRAGRLYLLEEVRVTSITGAAAAFVALTVEVLPSSTCRAIAFPRVPSHADTAPLLQHGTMTGTTTGTSGAKLLSSEVSRPHQQHMHTAWFSCFFPSDDDNAYAGVADSSPRAVPPTPNATCSASTPASVDPGPIYPLMVDAALADAMLSAWPLVGADSHSSAAHVLQVGYGLKCMLEKVLAQTPSSPFHHGDCTAPSVRAALVSHPLPLTPRPPLLQHPPRGIRSRQTRLSSARVHLCGVVVGTSYVTRGPLAGRTHARGSVLTRHRPSPLSQMVHSAATCATERRPQLRVTVRDADYADVADVYVDLELFEHPVGLVRAVG